MSQRSAKTIRRLESLEGRVDAWERAVSASRMEETLTLTQQRNDERRRAREAERAAAVYRTLLNLGLVVAVLALAVAIVLAAKMKAPVSTPEPAAQPKLTTSVTATTTATTQETREPRPAIILQPANYIENCTITFYCICKECCGKTPDHPDYGITASGRPAEPYVSVGVDPEVIPLGSTVSMDIGDGRGEQRYRADDTGSGVKGNHIDVCVTDHQTAEELGRRSASVVWTEPEVE